MKRTIGEWNYPQFVVEKLAIKPAKKNHKFSSPQPTECEYVTLYYGESFFVAFFYLLKYKIQTSCCVRLEWRK